MSSNSSSVEHLVLLNVKDRAEPSDVSAMLEAVNALRSLEEVKYLTAGPVHRAKSSSLNFTHIFRIKFLSKEDLAAYMTHPTHVAMAHSNVFPICDDFMILDWVSSGIPIGSDPKPGSAMRVQIVKLKEGMEETHKREVLDVVGALKDKLKGVEEVSFGENFSPEHAKGFSIAWTEVYPDGLDQLNSSREGVDDEIQNAYAKTREYIETYILVDYVVPSPKS